MRKAVVVVGVVILFFGIFLAAFGTRSYEVPYTTTETYTETYTQTLADDSDITIEPMHYVGWTGTIESGSTVGGTVDSDITVDVYVFTNEEFNNWEAGKSYDTVIYRGDTTSTGFSFYVSSTESYVFVIVNMHYTSTAHSSVTITREWEETKTREVTRYRTEFDYTLNYVGSVILFVGIGISAVGAVIKPPKVEEKVVEPPTPVVGITKPELPKEEIPEEKPSELFCPSCSSEVPPESEFCPHCGAKL